MVSYEELLYEELKKIVGNGKLTRSNIVVVLLSLMQTVEKYDKMDGPQKKAAVLNVIKHFIDDRIDGKQEAMEMKLLVDLTLPGVIDSFVSLDKKEVQIKVKKVWSCCK